MNKRKPRTAAHDVVAFQLLPANNGFWLEIQSTRLVHFELEYFALGVASYQRRGDIRGKTDQLRFRQFIDLGFDVMLVGITSAKIAIGKSVKGPTPEVFERSFREALFKPIPSGLLPLGASRREIVISKQGRRRKDQGGPYAGPYWAYGEYMYQPGLSQISPSRPKAKKAKKKNRKKSKGRRRKQ